MDLLLIKKSLKQHGYTCTGGHDKPLIVKFGGISSSLRISYNHNMKLLDYSYDQISMCLLAGCFIIAAMVSIGNNNYPSSGIFLAGGLVLLTRIIITEIKVTTLKQYLNIENIG